MRPTTFQVEITGISPLLQHRFGEQAEEGTRATVRAVHVRDEDPKTVALRSVYAEDGGALYHPGSSILRLLREAGGSHKQRGSRKSLKFIIPAAVLIPDEALPLFVANGGPDYHRGNRKSDVEVDSRPVTIPATKGRVMRHRGRMDRWQLRFTLEIDEEVMAPETVLQLLSEGGSRIGIGDYRPEKGGPFGRFQVTSWQPQ